MRFGSTSQTIAWFRDRYREGSLVLKPAYQRNPVWALRQKCSLIETILLELPVPEIYIQQSFSPEGKSQYAVVDGQQRTRSILQFLGIDKDPKEQSFNKFSLEKIATDSDWYDSTFSALPDPVKERFYGYKLVVRELETTSDKDLRDMFERLNRYLTPAKPQELRNARYVGPFKSHALRLADKPYWAEKAIVSAASIRRMGDVEFVSELLIGVLHGPQSGKASTINEYYRQYEDYEDEYPGQTKAEDLFEGSLILIQQLLPDISEHRWGNKTDFYTLFVAIASLMPSHEAPKGSGIKVLRSALLKFGGEVDRRLKDESISVNKDVIDYVRAVEKGANEKPRRAERHRVVEKLIKPCFKPKKDQ